MQSHESLIEYLPMSMKHSSYILLFFICYYNLGVTNPNGGKLLLILWSFIKEIIPATCIDVKLVPCPPVALPLRIIGDGNSSCTARSGYALPNLFYEPSFGDISNCFILSIYSYL